MKKDFTNKEYERYVDDISPKSNLARDTAYAFLVGGAICVLAEGIADFLRWQGAGEEAVKIALPIIMIALGAFFTGLGLYEKLAKYGGAGTIVPITGFANAIVSPAMEYKPEGHVMGVGAKMFVISGPVIVFGTIASIVVGLAKFLFF